MSVKTYVFDIDGTICTLTFGQYDEAIPLPERVSKINALFDAGNIIILNTARGMGSSQNNCHDAMSKWENLTKLQLEKWGVKYHFLFMCKPAGDIYVDDKGMSDEDFFR